MATYVYETIPTKKGAKPVQFEIRQSMKDDALKVHPETGEPVRRVISGGFGYIKTGGSHSTPSVSASGSCCSGGGCGCH